MRIRIRLHLLFLMALQIYALGKINAQQKSVFKQIQLGSSGVIPFELFCSKEGIVWISGSGGIWYFKDGQIKGPILSNRGTYKLDGNSGYRKLRLSWKSVPGLTKSNLIESENSHRTLYYNPVNHLFERPGYLEQGSDSTMYFITRDTIFFWKKNNDIKYFGYPGSASPLFKILMDRHDHIYEGGDGYVITKLTLHDTIDSKKVITKMLKRMHSWGYAGNNYAIHALALDKKIKNRIWVGTKKGLFYFNSDKEILTPASKVKNNITITEIYTGDEDKIWFSTLEKGMGFFNILKKTFSFFPYRSGSKSVSPISTFCYKAPNEFFVAALDSLPAIFNTINHNYSFIQDAAFEDSDNVTTDIKVDSKGSLILLKGGKVYYGKVSENAQIKSPAPNDSLIITPFISVIELSDNTPLANLEYHPERLKKITLDHDQNELIIYYNLNGFSNQKNILLEWRIEGYGADWKKEYHFDEFKMINMPYLKPGTYSLEVKLRSYTRDWQSQPAKLDIIIKPPFWRTMDFWIFVILIPAIIIFLIANFRIRSVRRTERTQAKHQQELLELEAKALRAQMNPHFIFNCLNSIKSLIQQHDEEKSITYLTTFSKLIRNLFNNADKKDISLYDEIETCKLYLQLEAMRFDTKFSYAVKVDENIDLKSIQVPALIIQPFIENAIWHGIMPHNSTGHVSLNVLRKDGIIEVVIDDDGIGREASQQNKSGSGLAHQSKGVNLTQTRLELNNLLQQRQAKLEVLDKKDEMGRPVGTKIILYFKESE